MTTNEHEEPLSIGVSARLLHKVPRELGFRGKTLQYLEQSAAHWIMSHGAMAFMIPTLLAETPQRREMVTATHYAARMDGLLLQGGADVDPRSYGDEPLRAEWSGDLVRDNYELSLIRAFIEQGKPVLGICRGMQLLNVAYGGTLWQDIPTQLATADTHHDSEQYDELVHDVRFVAGSVMERLLESSATAAVISIHHQCVRKLGDGLVAQAYSARDGIIEAFVADSANLVMGVQWHPEFHRSRGSRVLDCAPLLEAFIEAAGAHRARDHRRRG